MHMKTVSRYLPSSLVLDSSDNISFLLDLSDDPPPIAPDIVPPRRLKVAAIVDDSRCVGDVRERMGGFDARGMDVVGEVGDRILSAETGDRTFSTDGGERTWSVEVGEPRSAAMAMSRPTSTGACSSRSWSSEYAEEETDGLLRCTRVGGELTRRSMRSSSSVTSLWA